MATSRSPRLTFVTRLAVTFVVTVTLGVTGKDLPKEVAATKEDMDVRSRRSAEVGAPYGGCPVERNYVLFNDSCLKMYSVKQDYQTATMRCQTDGAHLFHLKSRVQDVPALVYLLDTMGKVLYDTPDGLWIGVNDIEVEGQFLWSDRSPLLRENGLWAPGEPNNSNNEDCVVVSNGIVFNDLPCTRKQEYICQVDI
ncbi:C-type lectin mannose-binding isoform-like [Pomacea canaliculata]|uniref:C-type lectin mannose-binding isoform-like n=1 Tax=Pomacea canaliculata TaxID=400727 RepID=UPI000D725837|nr:C-type lectin mannose-binding isoform-like [Pomacea canaliculata]